MGTGKLEVCRLGVGKSDECTFKLGFGSADEGNMDIRSKPQSECCVHHLT